MGLRRGFSKSRAALCLVATALVVGLLPSAASGAPKVSNPLVVRAAASPNPVVSGTELTYTITVTNNGGAAIDEVVTTDQINGIGGVDVGGTNQLILSSDIGTCTQSANAAGYLVRCEHGTMAGFAVATITIRGRVTAPAGTVLNNTATTTATKSAQTVSASATTSVQVTGGSGPLADLTASIAAPSAALHGSDYGATITVNNTGSVNASDVVVTATVAAGTTLSTWSSTSLFACADSPGPDGTTLLTCQGGAVNAGANAVLTLFLRAPAAAPPTSAVLRAQVDPTNTVAESNDLNNSAQATTSYTDSLPANALVVAKSAPNEVVQYELATYTLTVTNTSSSRADYVTLTDGTQGLDAASVMVNVVSAPASPGVTCSVAAPQVRCDTTRLAAGESFTVTVTGQVIAPAGSFLINTATVNGNIRNKGLTSTATGVTVVRPGVDLTVTQYRTFPVAPAPVRAADRFDYTITVGNSGLRDATNVVVREPLPAGVLLDGFTASDAGTTCTPTTPPATGGVVQCVIPLVEGAVNGGSAGGTTETIVLHLIAPQAVGAITSTVTVDPFNQIAEADETNNTFDTSTDVATGVDLTIAKVDDFDPVARNGTLRYTITVPNLGTQDASGIVVRDPLPAGTVFRSASGDHNFTCAFSGGVVTCTGGIIRGTYSGSLTQPVDIATITIDVFAPDEPGTIHNEVRVDPDNLIAEIDESNNLAFQDTKVENGSPNGAYKELDIPAITVNFDPIATSGTLDYTLTVRNTGSADAFNVTVQAALPAGATYRNAADLSPGAGSFTCSAAGTLVTCTGGTVTTGGTRQIRIATFAPATPGTATLTATVDPDNAIGEANESNNVTDKSVLVVAGSPNGIYNNLRVVDITDNFDPVAPSGTLIYTVAVENNGAADAFGVAMRATLPAGSIFRSAQDNAVDAGSFSCAEAGGVVTCSGARINAGAARQVAITVFAPAQPGQARLDVLVDPANTIPEGDESDNAAEEFTQVALGGGGGFIELSLTKTAPADVSPGATFDYTLKVKNSGTDDAFNVAVRDPLPTGVTFVAAFGDGNFTCTQAGGVVDCTGGYLPASDPDTERTITIRVKAPMINAPGAPIHNQAFVDPANAIAEASEVNNTASADTTVTSKVNLEIDVPDTSVSTGSDGHWIVTASNTGSEAAGPVTFEFNVAVGMIILDVKAPDGWSCTTNENPVNKVICTTSQFAASGTAALDVHVYKTAEGSVNGSAVIDPANTVVESNENDNSDTGTA